MNTKILALGLALSMLRWRRSHKMRTRRPPRPPTNGRRYTRPSNVRSTGKAAPSTDALANPLGAQPRSSPRGRRDDRRACDRAKPGHPSCGEAARPDALAAPSGSESSPRTHRLRRRAVSCTSRCGRELQSEMPAGHAGWMGQDRRTARWRSALQSDAGTVCADGAYASAAGDDGMHGPGMMHMEGAPPR